MGTRSFLTNGIVDNHAAFAAIEAAGTAHRSESHLFHRYGHHKLERWFIVHIGLATAEREELLFEDGTSQNHSLIACQTRDENDGAFQPSKSMR